MAMVQVHMWHRFRVRPADVMSLGTCLLPAQVCMAVVMYPGS